MPQISQIGTFISQIFWLIVTFGFLYIVLWKAALPRLSSILVYPASSPTAAAFITGRTDSKTFSVQNQTGGAPTSSGGSVAVNVGG